MRRGWSIRAKLVAVMMLATASALVIAGVATTWYDQRAYAQMRTADIITQTQLVGATSVGALAFGDTVAAEENLAVLRFRPRVVEAALYDVNGVLFATYARAGVVPRFPVEVGQAGVLPDGDDFVTFQSVVHNDEVVGTAYMRAQFGAGERLRDFLTLAGVAWLAAFGVAFLLALWLQRVITRPVLLVNDAARDILEHRDYTHRAEKVTDDEVGVLADSFNLMLDEIERRTSALEDSNMRLLEEIVARRKAEGEVRQLNESLEQRIAARTEDLERSNRELEAFSYTVSHDLRSPLRAITGFAHALKARLPADLDPESEAYFERIRAAIRRMGQRIDALLNLAHLSRQGMTETAVDLGGIAAEVLADLLQRDPQRVVDVRIASGAVVTGDPKLLRSLLENLLGNAWKFTGGRESARIEFGKTVKAGERVYFVRDDGPGFDMSFATKLFEPFQRAHAASEFPGTGIGLATVKRIVERHGGRVWVEAADGEGATFYFTIGEADQT